MGSHPGRRQVAPRRLAAVALGLAALACGGRATPEGRPRRAVEHVILVTIDGMVPPTYLAPDEHGLEVPVLRAMAKDGAASPGALSVMPSVTYPAHTSIATGVNPGRHGIVSNQALDPLAKNLGGWRWYAEDVAVPTIWDAALAAGLTTALINWPVTVGAKATYNVPEYWRAGTEDDAKLTRSWATPGLLDAVVAKHPDLWERFTPPNVHDSASVDVAVHLIETARPNLVVVHIWQVDDAQHGFGLWSDEAKKSLENADRQLGRLIDAAKHAGTWDRTVIVVASDHGFAPVSKQLKPGVLLAKAGLVTFDADGAVTAWRATAIASGGQAYVYLKDPADADAVRAALKDADGIARIQEADAIRAAGGDPKAFISLDGKPGWQFANGYTGEAVASTGKTVATHGWDPTTPEMQASLLFYGPPVSPRTLQDARLVDVAPTIATWLGLSFPGTDGRSLAP